MPSIKTPVTFFTQTIHTPALGNFVTDPDTSPTTTKSAVMPSEKTNRYMNPSKPLCVVETQVKTIAKAGAPHGAATIPDVAPSKKTAGYDTPPFLPPPPNFPAHATNRSGAAKGITSNITSPKRSNRFPMAKRAHTLAATVPNKDPVSPATNPMRAYSKAKPNTYDAVRPTVWARVRSSLPVPAKIPAVIGIIG